MKIKISSIVSVLGQLVVAIPTIIAAVKPIVRALKGSKPKATPEKKPEADASEIDPIPSA